MQALYSIVYEKKKERVVPFFLDIFIVLDF